MAPRKLVIRWPDRRALERDWEVNLARGHAFARAAAGYDRRAKVELVLSHPADRSQLSLPATVANTGDDGVGVDIDGFDPTLAATIRAFIDAPQAPRRAPAANVQERVRKLPIAQQLKLARTGELHERVALERLFGKSVWEALLANPKLTLPEVARIARKGTVPRPLLEQIVDNAGWLRAAPVRRALLSNPRLGGDAALKVLRATPPRELKLIERQSAYPWAVREAARRLTGRG